MPRFFIDLHEGENRQTDAAGRHCRDEEEAIATALETLKGSVEVGIAVPGSRCHRVTLRSESGAVLFGAVGKTKGVSVH